MAVKCLEWVYQHKKPLIWLLVLVVLPGTFVLNIMRDVFLPEIPWRTSESYDLTLFSPEKQVVSNINVVALYEGRYDDRSTVYGAQWTIFNKNLIYALEDKTGIERFLNLIKLSCQKYCSEFSNAKQKGQKEIHVVTFDYQSNSAGYFSMHFAELDGKDVTVFYIPDSLVAFSFEMTDFLSDLGITPE